MAGKKVAINKAQSPGNPGSGNPGPSTKTPPGRGRLAVADMGATPDNAKAESRVSGAAYVPSPKLVGPVSCDSSGKCGL